MKMGFDEFKENAGVEPNLPASEGDSQGGESGGEGTEPEPEPTAATPTMSVDMGPDGTNVSVDAPLNEMDPQEAINLAQEVQGPSMGEELKEVLLDPTVQDILREVWYGPDGQPNQQNSPQSTRTEHTTMDPTDKLDTDRTTEETPAATDGGEELREDNIYQITPEALVAILHQQVAEVAALKPDMTLTELSKFMEANEERLIGECEDLLEAMDSEE
jgi:hypothetical protein